MGHSQRRVGCERLGYRFGSMVQNNRYTGKGGVFKIMHIFLWKYRIKWYLWHL